MTICMFEKGNFISADAIIPLNNPNLEEGEFTKTENRSLKFEAQEVWLRHPVVASNIGNR